MRMAFSMEWSQRLTMTMMRSRLRRWLIQSSTFWSIWRKEDEP